MSARQNKKQRKGRNNPNNRERTVTTLTEDPNSSYLVPTPSEEPAGAALISAFAVNTPSVNPNNIPAQVFPMAPNFTFGYNGFAGPMHGNVHHQQHQPQQQNFFPQPQAPSIMLPPGKNDLEILENLKEMIKQGQHEFYRAVPQPAALGSLYLGPSAPPQHQVPHHPEQAPHDYHANDAQQQQQVPNQANADPTSPIDVGRRPPRMQNKEGWDPSGRKPIVPGPQPQNNVLSASSLRPLSAANTTFSQNTQAHNQQPTRYNGDNSSRNSLSNINTSSLNMGNIGTGPPSATVKNEPDVNSSVPGGGLTDSPSLRSARYDSAAQRPPGVPPSPGAGNQKVDQPRPLNDRLGHGESGYGGSRPSSGDISSEKNAVYDGKDDLARGREGWSHRDGPHPSDDRRHEPDRAGRPPGMNGQDYPIDRSIDRGPPMPPPLRDDRYPDRDRDERDRDRDRRRDLPPYDRDRDRRPYERPRDPRELRAPDMRRPDSRHYEPEYDRPPVRRFDGKDEPPISAGGRRLSDARPPIDDRGARPPPPVDDRLSSARPPVDSRPSVDSRPPLDHRALPDSRAQPPDDRSIRGPPLPPSNDRRGPPPDPRPGLGPFSSDRPAPPTPMARPTSAASRVPEDRGARLPPTPVEDRSARPQVPLEDRLSRPPSLQDRLNTPPASRVPESERFTRQASLEERIAPAGDHNGRPPPVDDHIRLSNATPDRERDRVPPRPVPGDERSRTSMPDPRVSPQDDRPVRPDDRGVRPEDRGVRPDVRVRPDDRSIRPDDRGVRPPDDRGVRPLDDRGVRPDDRVVRPDDRRPGDRVVRPDDRRPDERGRPVGGYSRPITPVAGSAPPGHRPYPPPPPQSQPPRPVAASARDDPRAVKPPQSPHRLPPRDYRPIDRDASRERPDVRPSSYHPDDRSYHDRRPDAMDVDAPRYESRDTRSSYDRPPFSPPSAADLARDHQRRANPFPPEPPRATPAAAPVDPSYDDRRYSGPPPARDWQYNERRARDYPPESDYKGRAAWDRSNPPPSSSDRDRFDRERDTRDTRDVPPPSRNHVWDPRDARDGRPQDRDIRDYPPRAASPPRSFDPQRPLGSRVVDTYPAPAPPVHADDRSYPPRDADRRPPSNHVLPSSYAGRVRPRSASPVRRIPPGPADDPRPPMKRQREDYPPAEYSYPPGGGRDPPRRTGDYPPRPGSPPHPPPSSASSYYDRPPIIPSAVAASAPNAPDRDYARDRVPSTHDYPPSSYERPRSPGQAPRMSQTYNRGGYTGSRDARDPRDIRPYMPPPPPPRAP